jgi:hypothetical protein
MIHRILISEKGSEVEHDLWPFEKTLEDYLVEYAPFDEEKVGRRRHIPQLARGKIVEHNNGCS